MTEHSHPEHQPHGASRPADQPKAAAQLQEILRGLAKQRGIRNSIMRVESGDGSFVWEAALDSSAPGRQLSADTPYLIASISKLYTATLVLLLAEDGLLDLDSLIGEYLPASFTKGIHVRRGVDSSEHITVRNLLAHSSGLANFLEDAPRGQRSLSARMFTEGDRDLTDVEVLAALRSLTAHFEPQPRLARRVRYSDTNYWLLGEIIGAVTGMRFEQVLEQRILRPLGLNQTYLPGSVGATGQLRNRADVWVNDRSSNCHGFCGPMPLQVGWLLLQQT